MTIKHDQPFTSELRGILLSVVNECENCAMMGERIMCQSAPKEEMRIKCVDQALSAIQSLILKELPENIPYDLRYNRALSQVKERLGVV